MEENSYRIRTKVGEESAGVLNVHLKQSYNTLEVLSLKIDQKNTYKLYQSDYGVIVGRVIANGGVGIPNAKVSIFIERDDSDDMGMKILYPFDTPQSVDDNNVRYNLLPDYVDSSCHQNVGTFPNKRKVLDNNSLIEVFEKYYKYTTTTNEAGDYMLFGVPSGSQKLHVDVDLSDIGIFSQRPRDMIYKGYNMNQFESPNKFKTGKNLAGLVQIYTQDIGVFVYPYWGDTTDNDNNIAVTRCDIQLAYQLEPTCVFIGSIITDAGSNSIQQNCSAAEKNGHMGEMVSGEGTIEIIRRTYDNKVEELQIKGNRVIDTEGVWCYQIPMNLDYVITDEFGNLVPSDNPQKGIATRARVRFRISLDEMPNDDKTRKRAKYLVPNNPRNDKDLYPDFYKTHEVDYEFGTKTKDENYCDLLWNKVYTVKNYIPRMQRSKKSDVKKHTGIKMISHHGDNNPMPFNGVNIKLSFIYRFICILLKIFVNFVRVINGVITYAFLLPCILYNFFHRIAMTRFLGIQPFKFLDGLAKLFLAVVGSCVKISSEMCDNYTSHHLTFYPGCETGLADKLLKYECVWKKTKEKHYKEERSLPAEEKTKPVRSVDELYNCVETALAEEYDVISFNFQNDWVNGTLYAPLWFRRILEKKKYFFGLITKKAKDQWCSATGKYSINPKHPLTKFQPCAVKRSGTKSYRNFNYKAVNAKYMKDGGCKEDCHNKKTSVQYENGLILEKENMFGQKIYYYRSVEVEPDGEVKLLFATDIVLLGSLNDYDMDGIQPFFKSLESTTFNLPPNILATDNTATIAINAKSDDVVEMSYEVDFESTSQIAGSDWGNFNDDLCESSSTSEKTTASGLFYSIGCSSVRMIPKSCINLSRVCEYGVTLDAVKEVLNNNKVKTDGSNIEESYDTLVPDGYISRDELYNNDQRSLFATLNGNKLRTTVDTTNGITRYKFKYLYLDNFDGSLYTEMWKNQSPCKKTPKFNYLLESFCKGYYDFRMGEKPYFYDGDHSFPRYENSFYFYFGLKEGKTAIQKFYTNFYSDCTNPNDALEIIGIDTRGNDWCSEANGNGNGYLALDLTNIDRPCDIYMERTDNDVSDDGFTINKNNHEKIYISGEQKVELEENGYVRIEGVHIENGEYILTITDSNGEIFDTKFSMDTKRLKFDVNIENFNDADNVLMYKFDGDRGLILSDTDQMEYNGRDIGGTIFIHNVSDDKDGKPITDYRIYIDCISNDDLGYHVKVDNSDGTDPSNGFLNKTETTFLFGIPKGDEYYRIKIVELCDNVETGNVATETIKFDKLTTYKLYINGVDYDVIKDWACGYDATYNSARATIGLNNERISEKWIKMSDINNYDWAEYGTMKKIDEEIVKVLNGQINTIQTRLTPKQFAMLKLLVNYDSLVEWHKMISVGNVTNNGGILAVDDTNANDTFIFNKYEH